MRPGILKVFGQLPGGWGPSRSSRYGLAATTAALCCALVLPSWALAAPAAVHTPPTTTASRSFDSFSELRSELLNAIGAATHRVWLTTEYLTDGEIVSALYVAQYRKVDVRVLIGRAKANFYMSRLNYLKNQNIPVYLRPDTFRPRVATQMLCDDTLLDIDGELDFMTRYKHFSVNVADGAAAKAYEAAFTKAAAMQVPANPAPMPLVGHARPSVYQSPSGRGGGAYRPHLSNSRYQTDDGSGAYTYDRHRTPRPDGVAAKLPKQLKWQRPAGAAPAVPTPSPVTIHQEQAPAPNLPEDKAIGKGPETFKAGNGPLANPTEPAPAAGPAGLPAELDPTRAAGAPAVGTPHGTTSGGAAAPNVTDETQHEGE